MNVTVTHEISEEQRKELRDLTDDLKGQLEKTFDSWKRTKTVFIYTVTVTGAASFVAGYLTGRLTK